MDEKKNLPSIQDLYKDTELAIKENQLNALLNQLPKGEWIVKHPTIKKESIDEQGKKIYVPIDYIPINRIEWLLTRIFLKWKVEVKDVQLIANSVQVTIRLYYKNPLDNEWDWNDGVGAVPIQTKKDSGAIDFNNMKSNAIMMAAPAAKTYAIKDAAEQIGRLFGRDLNRKDIAYYDEAMMKASEQMRISELRYKLSELVGMIQDEEEKKKIIENIREKEEKGEIDILFYQTQIQNLEQYDSSENK